MFSPAENRELFERAYSALGPRGQVVVQDFVLESSKTAPRAAAPFSLNMLVGTVLAIAQQELSLVIGAPELVGMLA
ncbi:MAG: hypothetical protein WB952_06325 [Terriglobales bacterium]